MTSSRPYLIRAMYQWIVDNGMTPHILVNAENESCVIPSEHVNEGKVVLNMAPMAVQGLTLGDNEITFSARFSGKQMNLYIPVEAVMAIYARENGQGMMYTEDDYEEGVTDDKPDPDKPRPNLKIVK